MNLTPRANLSEAEVKRGLQYIIWDGLASEAMNALTAGAFMVALALLMGASNFQIGVIASLPTFTNIFQLLAIWLVRKYNNRRAVSVFCSFLARTPLIIIGALAIFAPSFQNIHLLIFFLFFYYLFASFAGLSWNSWMKDLVPESMLGTYFSKRSKYSQIMNVSLSICLAFAVDYVKDNVPDKLLSAYGAMYIAGGIIGIIGAIFLSKAPEPQSILSKENIFVLLKRPLSDPNFRSLLIFNSAWVFALNLAIPFFSVYMLKTMNLSLSYIIVLTVISQLCSIFAVGLWGRFSDRYSNKTIIAIAAPMYIVCILAWCFVGIYTTFAANMTLLVLIHIFTGIATSGINLSLVNIGLKLASRKESIVYLSAKNIITAFFSSIAPLIGGILADFFTSRRLNITAEWTDPKLNKVFRLLALHEWNFLFLIGAFLALLSLQLLGRVKEVGEVEKDVVVRVMRSTIRSGLKERFIIGNLLSIPEQVWGIIKRKPSAADVSEEKNEL
ncbi:MAG: MFS transporter [Chitinophagaceae bacterium]|nr:MAG: MFS transporter [Chitinophagaceae bacterium]